jgi:diadenosine tetraphosphate (Ap4A) HIT family hydrolase
MRLIFMRQYKFIWNSPEYGEIPCNVHYDLADFLVIRAPDPYDPGEVQLSVPVGQVTQLEILS